MPYNGTGTFTISSAPFAPSTTISSTAVNADFSDIATNGLSNCLTKDGQQVITGQLKFPNGSAAAPAFTFNNDLTSGMFYVGTNKIGFATAGTARVYVDGSNVGVGQSGAQLYYANGAIVNPVGMVTDFGGSTIPSGWLLCYGQNISRTGYPELFQIIGTGFGAGDGSTTFTMPDLRGTITAGKDDMGGVAASRITAGGSGITGTTLGATGGAQNVTIAQANLPSVSLSSASLSAITTSSLTDNSFVKNVGAAGTIAYTAGANATTVSPGVTSSTGIFGTVPLGGSGTATNKMPPTMIMNKIMFAGRP